MLLWVHQNQNQTLVSVEPIKSESFLNISLVFYSLAFASDPINLLAVNLSFVEVLHSAVWRWAELKSRTGIKLWRCGFIRREAPVHLLCVGCCEEADWVCVDVRPRCWDDTDVSFIWWIIRVPITASLLVSPQQLQESSRMFALVPHGRSESLDCFISL